MDCFGVPKLWSIHSTPLDTNWCLGVFQSISVTFKVKDAKLTFGDWMHCFGVPRLWNISNGHKMMFGSVSEHFEPSIGNKMQNLCSEPEYTVSGYRSCEASILLHWTQIDVWECFGAFVLPSRGKRCKTCVRASMHYFGVSKSLNISIAPKVMFGSVSEYFTKLR
jgi:hypothetical protein